MDFLPLLLCDVLSLALLGLSVSMAVSSGDCPLWVPVLDSSLELRNPSQPPPSGVVYPLPMYSLQRESRFSTSREGFFSFGTFLESLTYWITSSLTSDLSLSLSGMRFLQSGQCKPWVILCYSSFSEILARSCRPFKIFQSLSILFFHFQIFFFS